MGLPRCSTPEHFCKEMVSSSLCSRCCRHVCGRCKTINQWGRPDQESSSAGVCFFCRVVDSAPIELEFEGQDKSGAQGTYKMEFFNSNNKGGLVIDVYFNTTDGSKLCITKGQWAMTVTNKNLTLHYLPWFCNCRDGRRRTNRLSASQLSILRECTS